MLVYKEDTSAHVGHLMVRTESWIRMNVVLFALLMAWNAVGLTPTLFTRQTMLVSNFLINTPF